MVSWKTQIPQSSFLQVQTCPPPQRQRENQSQSQGFPDNGEKKKTMAQFNTGVSKTLKSQWVGVQRLRILAEYKTRHTCRTKSLNAAGGYIFYKINQLCLLCSTKSCSSVAHTNTWQLHLKSR